MYFNIGESNIITQNVQMSHILLMEMNTKNAKEKRYFSDMRRTRQRWENYGTPYLFASYLVIFCLDLVPRFKCT